MGLFHTLSKTLKINVGGGLLPIAVGQLIQLSLTCRYREQAPSHIWIAFQGMYSCCLHSQLANKYRFAQ
ncbi:hypothetical protein C4J90_4048 [Pseudomonas sp. R2-60-08W]|nr:hypothetical protein C4J90_4048 [Pseudomonas sp. R2-60-08W]